ncbi:hypothetical protein PIB30_029467 [Stylosanthes scabra]|uniref:Uncharacterized protein n=1 Tax=Stylosanthes scabra TaxID=79078 RepID=A0ABU6QAY6_9FABA|nr:hypothetical protein [Stylosanthes scabra]
MRFSTIPHPSPPPFLIAASSSSRAGSCSRRRLLLCSFRFHCSSSPRSVPAASTAHSFPLLESRTATRESIIRSLPQIVTSPFRSANPPRSRIIWICITPWICNLTSQLMLFGLELVSLEWLNSLTIFAKRCNITLSKLLPHFYPYSLWLPRFCAKGMGFNEFNFNIQRNLLLYRRTRTISPAS